MATADSRVLTTSAPMPDILYFAPPSSLTETTEVPVQAEGNSDRDKLGLDDAEDQKIRGPKRDELWVTPDTREALVAPYLVAWRTKIERLGTMNFPAGRLACTGNAQSGRRGGDPRRRHARSPPSSSIRAARPSSTRRRWTS